MHVLDAYASTCMHLATVSWTAVCSLLVMSLVALAPRTPHKDTRLFAPSTQRLGHAVLRSGHTASPPTHTLAYKSLQHFRHYALAYKSLQHFRHYALTYRLLEHIH